MKYMRYVIMYNVQLLRYDKRLSIAQTSDRRIPNFQSVEQSITSFDIFKSDFLDF